MRGSPGGSGYENLVLELAKSLTRIEEKLEYQSKGREVKDDSTTQLATWARKPHSQVSKISFGPLDSTSAKELGRGTPKGSRL